MEASLVTDADVYRNAFQMLSRESFDLDRIPSPTEQLCPGRGPECAICTSYRLLAALADAATALGRRDVPTVRAMLVAVQRLSD